MQASVPIPDDVLNGVLRSEMHCFWRTPFPDRQNTCMFRDGSMDSIEFQKNNFTDICILLSSIKTYKWTK